MGFWSVVYFQLLVHSNTVVTANFHLLWNDYDRCGPFTLGHFFEDVNVISLHLLAGALQLCSLVSQLLFGCSFLVNFYGGYADRICPFVIVALHVHKVTVLGSMISPSTSKAQGIHAVFCMLNFSTMLSILGTLHCSWLLSSLGLHPSFSSGWRLDPAVTSVNFCIAACTASYLLRSWHS